MPADFCRSTCSVATICRQPSCGGRMPVRRRRRSAPAGPVSGSPVAPAAASPGPGLVGGIAADFAGAPVRFGEGAAWVRTCSRRSGRQVCLWPGFVSAVRSLGFGCAHRCSHRPVHPRLGLVSATGWLGFACAYRRLRWVCASARHPREPGDLPDMRLGSNVHADGSRRPVHRRLGFVSLMGCSGSDVHAGDSDWSTRRRLGFARVGRRHGLVPGA